MSWATDLLSNDKLVFWGCITLICIVPTICSYWWKVRRHEANVQLKLSMIERGMSVEEIERVIDAGKKGNFAGHSSNHETERP